MKNYTPQTIAEMHLQWLCTQLKKAELIPVDDMLNDSEIKVMNEMITRYGA